MTHEIVRTSDLRPGDVVATAPARHIGARDVVRFPVHFLTGSLAHRAQWRTVNAVTPVNLSVTRVEFTDGTYDRAAWNHDQWARKVYSNHADEPQGGDAR